MAALFLCVTTVLPAQVKQRATGAAAFFKEPNGLRLGTLVSGIEYAVGKVEGTFVQTTIEGWVPSGAVEPTTRDGFDLTVVANGGESLRAAPGGAVLARVTEGTLLKRVSARGKWVQVRRQGWVGRAGLSGRVDAAATATAPPKPQTLSNVSPSKPAPSPAPVPPPAPAPAPAPTSAITSPPSPSSGQDPKQSAARDTSNKDAASSASVSERVSLRPGTRISAAQDGAPIAAADRVADAEVIERSRDWVKVRFEGWVKSTDIAGVADVGPRITSAMIRAHPDKFVGQSISWRLQFLAVQEADELRPEMNRGQLYLLTRGPLPESGFVYVMVTKAQADEYRKAQPLDEIRVQGVIRSGRTRYLPTPVVELQ